MRSNILKFFSYQCFLPFKNRLCFRLFVSNFLNSSKTKLKNEAQHPIFDPRNFRFYCNAKVTKRDESNSKEISSGSVEIQVNVTGGKISKESGDESGENTKRKLRLKRKSDSSGSSESNSNSGESKEDENESNEKDSQKVTTEKCTPKVEATTEKVTPKLEVTTEKMTLKVEATTEKMAEKLEVTTAKNSEKVESATEKDAKEIAIETTDKN